MSSEHLRQTARASWTIIFLIRGRLVALRLEIVKPHHSLSSVMHSENGLLNRIGQ